MNMNDTLQRRGNGSTVPGQSFVAADIIALVSGVNLSSVNKVLLALNVIADGLDIENAHLLNPSALPGERADAARYAATEEVAHRLVTTPEARVAEPYLHFIDRMSRH